MAKTRFSSAGEFQEWLVKQTPVFDAEILADIRPESIWLINAQTGPFDPYDDTLQKVRKLSEGLAYRKLTNG